jgi:hypothetical protein
MSILAMEWKEKDRKSAMTLDKDVSPKFINVGGE